MEFIQEIEYDLFGTSKVSRGKTKLKINKVWLQCGVFLKIISLFQMNILTSYNQKSLFRRGKQ